MPSLTAYSSFYEIGPAEDGGRRIHLSGQWGCRAASRSSGEARGLKSIGSVGDDKKSDFVMHELGFDGELNYTKDKQADALKQLAPNGIYINFENVGGEHLEAALNAVQNHGRIVACGIVSQYSLPGRERYPLRKFEQSIAKRINMRDFIVGDSDMGAKHAKEYQDNVQRCIADGSIKAKLSLTNVIDHAADRCLLLP